MQKILWEDLSHIYVSFSFILEQIVKLFQMHVCINKLNSTHFNISFKKDCSENLETWLHNFYIKANKIKIFWKSQTTYKNILKADICILF